MGSLQENGYHLMEFLGENMRSNMPWAGGYGLRLWRRWEL